MSIRSGLDKVQHIVACAKRVLLFFATGQTHLAHKSKEELKEYSKYKHRNRGSVTLIATRLAISRNHELIVPEWLAPTHKDKLPKAERVAFPKPPKGPGTNELISSFT